MKIIVVDIEMPLVSGIALAKQLKKYHPMLNIIFATGSLGINIDKKD